MGIFDFNEEEWEEVVREESYLEGKAEGKAEDIISILGQLGDVPGDVIHMVHDEKELDKLKKWILVAAKADTIEDFLAKIDDNGMNQ